MDEGCGGHATVDSLLPRHSTLVHHCVAEESKLSFSFELDTVGMVLASHRWRTVQDRTQILMTPRLKELRIKELTRGLDGIKKHMAAGNLGRACELLQQTFQELKLLSRKAKR